MNGEYKYLAFISYKREDEKWAKWLQHRLEHYKLPTEVRKVNPSLPELARPVFKDTTDLAGGVLEKAIKDALDASKYLIVICSPRAAQSPWVCKEVAMFIDSGKEEYIIPFIIDGEPNSSNIDIECFPQKLKELSGPRELLGININEMGRDAAAIKVVARMFELQFDTLWQRSQQEQSRRRKTVIVGLIGIITVVVGIAIWISLQNIKIQQQNEELEKRYIIINEQKDELRKNEEQIQRQLDLSIRQRDSLSILAYELRQKNDSLLKQKKVIVKYVHENKHLKDENEELKRQKYIDMKNELNNQRMSFGL